MISVGHFCHFYQLKDSKRSRQYYFSCRPLKAIDLLTVKDITPAKEHHLLVRLFNNLKNYKDQFFTIYEGCLFISDWSQFDLILANEHSKISDDDMRLFRARLMEEALDVNPLKDDNFLIEQGLMSRCLGVMSSCLAS